MVGGFVEQHHVRPHQKDAGKRDAHLPAAGKLGNIAVHHLLAEAQPVQHLTRTAFQRVTIKLFVPRLHFAVTFDDGVHLVHPVGIGHGGFQFPKLRRDLADRACTLHNLGHGRAAGHFTDILIEIADRHALFDDDLTLVRLLLAGDHPEKRGLAGTVRTDKADLLTAIERGGGLDIENAVTVRLADVFDADHDRACEWERPSYATGRRRCHLPHMFCQPCGGEGAPARRRRKRN